MKGKILLARPHPFIVKAMQDFLKRNDLEAVVVHELSELSNINEKDSTFKGAVISTSLISDVKESYYEVFAEIRAKFEQLPVAFATLVDFKSIAPAIKRHLDDLLEGEKILPISEETLSGSDLGKPDTFIVFEKKDLEPGEKGLLADKIIRKHCKL